MKRRITRRKKKEDISCLYELRYYVRESKEEEFSDYMVLSHASDRASVEEAAENMGIDVIPKGVFTGDVLEYAQICEFPQEC